VRQAIENDVHAVGISSLAGAHLTLVPLVVAGCGPPGPPRSRGRRGVIPPQDLGPLAAAGRAVFGPGPRPRRRAPVLELVRAAVRP